MAAIRKVAKHGRVRWRLSWYDACGQRRQRFFKRRDDATAAQGRAIKESEQKRVPTVDPSCTLAEYAADWLPRHAAVMNLKPATRESYEATLRLHILPALGTIKLRTLSRQQIYRLAARRIQAGAARHSVVIL